MGEKTKIDWCDHTFNPVWGCVETSTGCENCFARKLAERWGYDVWGPNKERRTFGQKHWYEPDKWNRKAEEAGERHRVFCGSMCDWAEDHPTAKAERVWLADVILSTPSLDWLLLTKRIQNVERIISDEWPELSWPLPNAWLGVTAENQEMADLRIPILLQIPAATRFVSYEPALGPLDIEGLPVDWVIAGCESGPKRRDAAPSWFRDLRDECQEAGIPFFLKQMSVDGKLVKMPALDGVVYDQFPGFGKH
jgi:protein gp37